MGCLCFGAKENLEDLSAPLAPAVPKPRAGNAQQQNGRAAGRTATPAEPPTATAGDSSTATGNAHQTTLATAQARMRKTSSGRGLSAGGASQGSRQPSSGGGAPGLQSAGSGDSAAAAGATGPSAVSMGEASLADPRTHGPTRAKPTIVIPPSPPSPPPVPKAANWDIDPAQTQHTQPQSGQAAEQADVDDVVVDMEEVQELSPIPSNSVTPASRPLTGRELVGPGGPLPHGRSSGFQPSPSNLGHGRPSGQVHEFSSSSSGDEPGGDEATGKRTVTSTPGKSPTALIYSQQEPISVDNGPISAVQKGSSRMSNQKDPSLPSPSPRPQHQGRQQQGGRGGRVSTSSSRTSSSSRTPSGDGSMATGLSPRHHQRPLRQTSRQSGRSVQEEGEVGTPGPRGRMSSTSSSSSHAQANPPKAPSSRPSSARSREFQAPQQREQQPVADDEGASVASGSRTSRSSRSNARTAAPSVGEAPLASPQGGAPSQLQQHLHVQRQQHQMEVDEEAIEQPQPRRMAAGPNASSRQLALGNGLARHLTRQDSGLSDDSDLSLPGEYERYGGGSSEDDEVADRQYEQALTAAGGQVAPGATARTVSLPGITPVKATVVHEAAVPASSARGTGYENPIWRDGEQVDEEEAGSPEDARKKMLQLQALSAQHPDPQQQQQQDDERGSVRNLGSDFDSDSSSDVEGAGTQEVATANSKAQTSGTSADEAGSGAAKAKSDSGGSHGEEAMDDCGPTGRWDSDEDSDGGDAAPWGSPHEEQQLPQRKDPIQWTGVYEGPAGGSLASAQHGPKDIAIAMTTMAQAAAAAAASSASPASHEEEAAGVRAVERAPSLAKTASVVEETLATVVVAPVLLATSATPTALAEVLPVEVVAAPGDATALVGASGSAIKAVKTTPDKHDSTAALAAPLAATPTATTPTAGQRNDGGLEQPPGAQTPPLQPRRPSATGGTTGAPPTTPAATNPGRATAASTTPAKPAPQPAAKAAAPAPPKAPAAGAKAGTATTPTGVAADKAQSGTQSAQPNVPHFMLPTRSAAAHRRSSDEGSGHTPIGASSAASGSGGFSATRNTSSGSNAAAGTAGKAAPAAATKPAAAAPVKTTPPARPAPVPSANGNTTTAAAKPAAATAAAGAKAPGSAAAPAPAAKPPAPVSNLHPPQDTVNPSPPAAAGSKPAATTSNGTAAATAKPVAAKAATTTTAGAGKAAPAAAGTAASTKHTAAKPTATAAAAHVSSKSVQPASAPAASAAPPSATAGAASAPAVKESGPAGPTPAAAAGLPFGEWRVVRLKKEMRCCACEGTVAQETHDGSMEVFQCEEVLPPGALAAVISHSVFATPEGGGDGGAAAANASPQPKTWIFCPDPLCMESKPVGSNLPQWPSKIILAGGVKVTRAEYDHLKGLGLDVTLPPKVSATAPVAASG